MVLQIIIEKHLEYVKNLLKNIYFYNMTNINRFDINNKDFDKFIIVNIKINVSNFENYKKENCEIFRLYIEEKIKKFVVTKIKEKNLNVVEFSRKYNIPIKNILYSIFINTRIDNIDIIWSPSSIKEFKYVPIQHYLDYEEDTLYLKTKRFKFKKTF
jgi:hypothetical protein